MKAYAENINESEQVRTSTKWLHVTVYVKYEKEDLNKNMKNQYQYLTETQRKKLLKLLQKMNSCPMKHLLPGKQIQ